MGERGYVKVYPLEADPTQGKVSARAPVLEAIEAQLRAVKATTGEASRKAPRAFPALARWLSLLLDEPYEGLALSALIVEQDATAALWHAPHLLQPHHLEWIDDT